MARNLSGLLAGLLFGLGLMISEMTNPAKVLSFLDVLGHWDPSLAFVMGTALIVTALGYRLTWRASAPIFDTRFRLPDNRRIDVRLVVGALLFGAGWGLVGLCPGPAVAALTIGGAPVLLFVASMLAGMAIHEFISRANKGSGGVRGAGTSMDGSETI